jgi:hypothetical protein
MSSSAPRRLAPFLKWSGWVVLVLTALIVAAVISMALWFRASPPQLWIALWIAAIAGALVGGVRYGPWSGFGLVVLATGIFALWWMTIQPSNDRDWQPDVAQLLTAAFDPDDPSRVVLRNVRNFDWQPRRPRHRHGPRNHGGLFWAPLEARCWPRH